MQVKILEEEPERVMRWAAGADRAGLASAAQQAFGGEVRQCASGRADGDAEATGERAELRDDLDAVRPYLIAILEICELA